jgi:hypothetical protein
MHSHPSRARRETSKIQLIAIATKPALIATKPTLIATN